MRSAYIILFSRHNDIIKYVDFKVMRLKDKFLRRIFVPMRQSQMYVNNCIIWSLILCILHKIIYGR